MTNVRKLTKPDIEESARAIRAKQEGANLKRENIALHKEREQMRRQLDVLAHLERARSTTYKILPAKGHRGSEATAVLVLSDVHVEERVDAKTVNNVNEYNIDIARESVGRFFSNGLRLVDICRKDIAIKEIVLAVLGDMINGYIHDEYLEDNYLSPLQATLEAEALLRGGIKYLLEHSDARITVVCKHGNHGRTTDKPRIATYHKNSFEWLMYRHIAGEFADEPRVRFSHEDGYVTWLDIYDRYPIRFHHGDAIRYKDGVGGITIPVMKAIAKWDQERKATVDVFGHLHQLALDAPGGKFIANGSIVGYNPYAMFMRCAYEPPRQAFFLVDKERGVTMRAPIFVR